MLGTVRSTHHVFCHCTDRVQTLKALMLGTVRSTHHAFCHCTDRVQTLKAHEGQGSCSVEMLPASFCRHSARVSPWILPCFDRNFPWRIPLGFTML
jgi:hypothetical protein